MQYICTYMNIYIYIYHMYIYMCKKLEENKSFGSAPCRAMERSGVTEQAARLAHVGDGCHTALPRSAVGI